jgi:hypothetical protein
MGKPEATPRARTLRLEATPTAGATLRSETMRRPLRIQPQDVRRVRPAPAVPAPPSAHIAAMAAASVAEARTPAQRRARGKSSRPPALATPPQRMRAVRAEVTPAKQARAAAGRPNAASAYPTRAASSVPPLATRARRTVAPARRPARRRRTAVRVRRGHSAVGRASAERASSRASLVARMHCLGLRSARVATGVAVPVSLNCGPGAGPGDASERGCHDSATASPLDQPWHAISAPASLRLSGHEAAHE